MPEEINRVVTDRIADLLLTPSRDGDEKPPARGRAGVEDQVRRQHHDRHPVPASADGRSRPRQRSHNGRGQAVRRADAAPAVECRSPGNVRSILDAVNAVARDMPVVFPVHPRTRNRIAELGLSDAVKPLTLVDPLGYIDFLSLTSHARLILTDSGGLQEESTALGIPCLTLRENTERPVTVTHGTNRVVGMKTADILAAIARRSPAEKRSGA